MKFKLVRDSQNYLHPSNSRPPVDIEVENLEALLALASSEKEGPLVLNQLSDGTWELVWLEVYTH